MPRTGRRPRPSVASLVLLSVLLIAVDLVGGVVIWPAPSTPRPGWSTYPLEPAQPPPPAGTQPAEPVPAVTEPALADSPWAQDFFTELRTQDQQTTPYVNFEYRDRAGRYLNVRDQLRVSHTAHRGPVVWFFGGSAVFGEGQRDGHTIPSEVARIAGANGHPIQVRNFGVQADSNFQSMLRLEQALAVRRPKPDVVVFYDGANDVSQHLSQPPTDQPSVYQGIGGPSSPDDDDAFAAWKRASLLVQFWNLRDRSSTSALPAPPDVLAAQTLGVYERGVSLARWLTEAEGATFLSFFQPAALYEEPAVVPVVDAIRSGLPEGTIDLSSRLAEALRPNFYDPVHTNERGARLVAAAIYEDLEPSIVSRGG